MARHRTSSKRPPPEIGLHMECIEEELEPSQITYYTKGDKEFSEIQNKLEHYVKKLKAEVIEKGENCLVLQLNAMSNSVSMGSQGQVSSGTTGSKGTRQSVQATQSYQQMVGQGILTRSTANSSANTFLVMDSGLSFMVGQMSPSNVTPEQTSATSTPKSVSGTRNRQSVTSGSIVVTTRAKIGSKKQPSGSAEAEILTSPATRTRDKSKNQTHIQQQTSPQSLQQIVQDQQIYSSGNALGTSGNYRMKMNAKQVQPPSKPTENNAVGGLSAGSKSSWKPTSDEGTNSKGNPDSREVTFNKVTGKTFPSLVVVARPHLKAKYISQSKITQERTALDAKVKGVLMYTTTKFTEWLIQQGLIRSEQICQTHLNNDLSVVKLKLGMYSDISKFPYSGGYVWISDCCPSQFVSVFSGSIFEGAPHPPTTLLKLIYHWACQTNVQNIVQWVKVDNLYVKNFFTNMRAVCTQAVHEKYKKMGGPRKKIEVGVISLGTTSQDGNKRQVKVEVLGVMDYENKLIRLRAVEPHSDERSFKRRFVRILQPLEEWVSKDSTILTDFTVNKAALNSMGFHTVYQVTSDVKYSNQNVMEYLRRIVPRMFQNTLSLLSRQIIQQFLDELVWREVWGPIPSQAFVSIIAHMAEQTKLDVSENFLVRLSRVAANPFKSWSYSAWSSEITTINSSKAQQKPPSSSLHENIPTVSSENTGNSGKNTRTRKRTVEQSVTEITVSPSPPKKVAKISFKEKAKKDEKTKVSEKLLKKEKESGEKLSEEEINFINDGKQIPLETYYYGSKKGSDTAKNSVPFTFNVKCCVCNKRFFENIVLMKHMVLHCQTEPALTINLKKVHQCENCFTGLDTAAALKTHLEEVHFLVNNKMNTGFFCHICEKKFTCRYELICHMHRAHVALEMPYVCGVCHFRTSVYRLFVQHFVQVHKGEDHVFCPYCLKVISLSYKGTAIVRNVLFYISHLEKHQRLSLIGDCKCCKLSFIHKGILDQHLEADHDSWINEDGIEAIEELSAGLLMPEPGGFIKPAPIVKLYKSPKMKNTSTLNKFKALEIKGLEENLTCIECEEFLLHSEHFVGNFNCLKCRYATCCERAMSEHVVIFHEAATPQFTIGKSTVLPAEMFCICGYSSSSGNRLAKHLALCEKKTAYTNIESTAIDSSLNLTKEEIQESTRGEGQNVLNMLGLIRKSSEGHSAERKSVQANAEQKSEEENKEDPKERQEENDLALVQSPPSNCVSASVKNVENLTDENVLVEENLQLAMSPAKVEPLNNATAAEKHSEVIPEGETDGHKCLEAPVEIIDEKNQVLPSYQVDCLKSDETVNAKEESQNEAVLRKESENLKTDPVIEKAFCNAEPLDKADDTSISEKTLVAHENTELENNKKDNSNEEMEKLETEKSNNSEDATVKVEDCLCEGDNNKDELKKNVDEEINKELTEVEVKGEELNQKEILNTTKENFIEREPE